MDGWWMSIRMSESGAFAWILAYMAENRLKTSLKADTLQKVAAEATTIENLEVNENDHFG